MVVKVLQVLTALVKYGYYDDSEDIEDLLPAIHELLDGQDDYPTRKIRLKFDHSMWYKPMASSVLKVSHVMSVWFSIRAIPFYLKVKCNLPIITLR